MTPLQLKNLAIKILNEHKAEDITSINVGKLTSVTDYMIICSATSTRHIKALANHLITTCKENDVRPLGAEGIDGSHEWALIDLGDIIVHIMLAATRDFYSLEKLWQVSEQRAKTATEKVIKPKKTIKKTPKPKTTKTTKAKTIKPKRQKQ